MDLIGRVGRAGGVAVLVAGVAGCAPTLRQYGEPALPARQYLALDSAVARNLGVPVTVWVQLDLAPPPGRLPPSDVRLRGRLSGAHDGWLHLLRGPEDTIRIGKDYVQRILMVRPAADKRVAGAVVGAVAVGMAGLFLARSDPDRSGASSLALVGGGVILGAGLGALLIPGTRAGPQLYPPAYTSPRRTP